MSDWTPTTELVRAAFIEDPVAEYHDPINYAANSREAGRTFDRWLESELAAARRAGRVEQREVDARIAERFSVPDFSGFGPEGRKFAEGRNSGIAGAAHVIRNTEIGETP